MEVYSTLPLQFLTIPISSVASLRCKPCRMFHPRCKPSFQRVHQGVLKLNRQISLKHLSILSATTQLLGASVLLPNLHSTPWRIERLNATIKRYAFTSAPKRAPAMGCRDVDTLVDGHSGNSGKKTGRFRMFSHYIKFIQIWDAEI